VQHTVNLWPLLGVAVIVLGFAARPSGAGGDCRLRRHRHCRRHAGGSSAGHTGHGLHQDPQPALILLLPIAAIGLLERHGLKEHAQASIARIRSATTGRLLIVYLAIRELAPRSA
jgi:uncharacterized membrane protein